MFWPAQGALLVADLHFEKASWYARFGQFLPPHDSAATLDMIEALVARTGARAIWSLGDSFHDADGAARLDPRARARLQALTERLDWLWITGNHDVGVAQMPGGRRAVEAEVDGVWLRHEADPADPGRRYRAISTPSCACRCAAGMYRAAASSDRRPS